MRMRMIITIAALILCLFGLYILRRKSSYETFSSNAPRDIILIQQYYIDKSPERQKENDYCIHDNVNNPAISHIYLLNEKIYTLPILNNPKITQINLGKRLNFYDVFEFTKTLDSTAIKILSNSDMTFETESLRKLQTMKLDKTCLALTRYDVDNYEPFEYHLRSDVASESQDTWIFTDITPTEDMKFNLGVPGCDNRIVKIIHDLGFQVKNNSLTIKTFHHHKSQIRNYTNQDRLSGEYMSVSPTE